jgi:hypothetical protein
MREAPPPSLPRPVRDRPRPRRPGRSASGQPPATPLAPVFATGCNSAAPPTPQLSQPAPKTPYPPKVVSLRGWKLLNVRPLPLSEEEIKHRMALSTLRRHHHPDLLGEPGTRKRGRPILGLKH